MNAILVAGGAGYVGSHTSYLLAQHGYQVIILDTFWQKQPFTAPWATVIKGDCADSDLIVRLCKKYRIDALMHFAAYIAVGESVSDPARYYHNNVARSIALFDAIRVCGVRDIVFSSTAAVYGDPTIIPIPEGHSKNPINPYGRAKQMVEHILDDYVHAYDMRCVSLRYFNAAGLIPEHGLIEWHIPETHIIPLLLCAVIQEKPFYIFGEDYQTPDGSCIRDYVHVKDIAEAHLKALKYIQHGHQSDVFNLGTGKGISVKQIIDIAQQITKKEIQTISGPRRSGDPAVLIADATKADRLLKWKPHNSDPWHIIKSVWTSLCRDPLVASKKSNRVY